MTRQEIEFGQETASARRRGMIQRLTFIASMALLCVLAVHYESGRSLKEAVIDSWHASSHAAASLMSKLQKL